LAAEPQQLPSACAWATVPQHVVAGWLGLVVAGAGPPQQPLATGGWNASAGSPAKPPTGLVVDSVVIVSSVLRLSGLAREDLEGYLVADAIDPRLRPALRGADLAALVTELHTVQRRSPPTKPSPHDRSPCLDIHRISNTA
jgi:hypothetical protein